MDNSTYQVIVHIDELGNLVKTQNSTFSSKPTESEYESKEAESAGTVDANTIEEVTSFLEIFCKPYLQSNQR